MLKDSNAKHHSMPRSKSAAKTAESLRPTSSSNKLDVGAVFSVIITRNDDMIKMTFLLFACSNFSRRIIQRLAGKFIENRLFGLFNGKRLRSEFKMQNVEKYRLIRDKGHALLGFFFTSSLAIMQKESTYKTYSNVQRHPMIKRATSLTNTTQETTHKKNICD